MDNIDNLAVAWRQAKQREQDANAERVAIEQQILALHPAREEGSESFTTTAGAKVTLTGKLTYKVDVQKLVVLTNTWPADLRPLKVETKADETKLKAIRRDTPNLWKDIAAAINVYRAKTGVSIDFPEA